MQTDERQVYGEGRPGNASVRYPAGRQLREIEKQIPLRTLSDDDWAHWKTFGYVVVPNAVPPEQVAATVAMLWEFEERDPNDPSTWFAAQRRDHDMQELNNSGMVEVYNHPTLWENRQTPRVYNAFVDIWDREDLWVTIDRANFNTPNRGARGFGGFLHWDVDTTLDPPPINVQGVLALSDTDEATGGFQCARELFRDFDEWKGSQPADRDGWKPEPADIRVDFIPLKAGDLIIWNSLLAHGIRPNTSERVRMAQYIAMTPAQEQKTELRDWRVRSWREKLPPEGYAFPGDPRGLERRDPVAELTPLGERLLGLQSWNS